MMTSSNEIIFRNTGHLCGDFTGDRGWVRGGGGGGDGFSDSSYFIYGHLGE